MTKEELIITEKYDKYQENEIDNLYINLYSSKVNDPIKIASTMKQIKDGIEKTKELQKTFETTVNEIAAD